MLRIVGATVITGLGVVWEYDEKIKELGSFWNGVIFSEQLVSLHLPSGRIIKSEAILTNVCVPVL